MIRMMLESQKIAAHSQPLASLVSHAIRRAVRRGRISALTGDQLSSSIVARTEARTPAQTYSRYAASQLEVVAIMRQRGEYTSAKYILETVHYAIRRSKLQQAA